MGIEKRSKGANKVMKILFVPYGEKNAYHRLLTTALRSQGVETKAGQVLSLFSLFRQVIRERNIDIVHIVWTDPFFISKSKVKTLIRAILFILDLLIIKTLRIKIVWTVHNKYNHEEQHKDIDILVSKILSRICDVMKVECKKAKSDIIRLFNVKNPSKIEVISEGSYIEAYPNEVDRGLSREKLGLKPEEIIFLYFGQIRPYKGVPELIEAFKKLNHPQAKLLIVGKPLNNEVANAVMRRCIGVKHIRTIFKFIPDDEIQMYMYAADIIVLPYRDILTSGAVILAMSFGKPVIAPAIGCIPDVLDSEGSILYDPSEKEGLVKAMKQALDANLKKMGEHNLELAKQLRWDDIAKRTCEVYQECLRDKR